MSLPANAFCSIARTLEVLGQKWNLLLLREAFYGRTRYGEFQRIGIPSDTLAARLDSLVAAGLLERRSYQPDGKRTRDEYVLTAAGKDAITVLAALSEWGDRHLPLPDGPGIVFEVGDTGEPVHLRFLTEGGREVAADEVTAVHGPGWFAAKARLAADN